MPQDMYAPAHYLLSEERWNRKAIFEADLEQRGYWHEVSQSNMPGRDKKTEFRMKYCREAGIRGGCPRCNAPHCGN
jgi:hypothetical protein